MHFLYRWFRSKVSFQIVRYSNYYTGHILCRENGMKMKLNWKFCFLNTVRSDMIWALLTIMNKLLFVIIVSIRTFNYILCTLSWCICWQATKRRIFHFFFIYFIKFIKNTLQKYKHSYDNHYHSWSKITRYYMKYNGWKCA